MTKTQLFGRCSGAQIQIMQGDEKIICRYKFDVECGMIVTDNPDIEEFLFDECQIIGRKFSQMTLDECKEFAEISSKSLHTLHYISCDWLFEHNVFPDEYFEPQGKDKLSWCIEETK